MAASGGAAAAGGACTSRTRDGQPGCFDDSRQRLPSCALTNETHTHAPHELGLLAVVYDSLKTHHRFLQALEFLCLKFEQRGIVHRLPFSGQVTFSHSTSANSGAVDWALQRGGPIDVVVRLRTAPTPQLDHPQVEGSKPSVESPFGRVRGERAGRGGGRNRPGLWLPSPSTFHMPPRLRLVLLRGNHPRSCRPARGRGADTATLLGNPAIHLLLYRSRLAGTAQVALHLPPRLVHALRPVRVDAADDQLRDLGVPAQRSKFTT